MTFLVEQQRNPIHMSAENYDPLAAYRQPSLWDWFRAHLADPGIRASLVMVLLLIAGTVALYGGYLHNPLVFDDFSLLNDKSIAAIAAGPKFVAIPRWLVNLSFGITYQLAGNDIVWYRLGNVLIHTLSVVMIYFFIARLVGAVGVEKGPISTDTVRLAAFLGAIWFAFQPVAVYGVAYLIQRSIIMATFFGICALHSYLIGIATGAARWLVFSLLLYALALSSKEQAVMLPIAALGISLLLGKPGLPQIRKHGLPVGIVLLFAIAIAVWVVVFKKDLLFGAPYEPRAFEILRQMHSYQMGPNLENAYQLSILTQMHLFFKYLLVWVIPFPGWMSIDLREPLATSLTAFPYLVSAAAFIAYPIAAILLIRKGGRLGLAGLGMVFPWIMYLPQLSAIQVVEIFVLYRSYLWMSGLPLVVAALFLGSDKRTLTVSAAAVVSIFCFAAVNRLDTFANRISLWTDAIEKNAGKLNQGAERSYFIRGLASIEEERFDEAVADFKAATALHSSTLLSALSGDRGIEYFHYNDLIGPTRRLLELKVLNDEIRETGGSAELFIKRGKLNAGLARQLDAAKDFGEAIRLDPDNAGESLTNRALVFYKSGGPSGSDAAIADLNRAIAAAPKFAKAYMTRGLVLTAQGKHSEAMADFEKAVALSPKDGEIHFNRGNAFVMMNRFDEAFKHYGKAIEYDSSLADAYVNRGSILMQRGRLDEAVAEFEAAIRQNPDTENAYFNRAKIRLARGEKDGALSDFEKVLKLNHQDKEALFERSLLLEEKGLKKEARISFQRSCDAGNERGCAKLKEMAR